ncbi:MAG: TIGR04282 family arsenosugar biosynthesis glycosyltransferase [Gammaproteobacteria bacterium]|nr:TIGR04282 family arsenosugar biosynthesis glycosyltransferase [Gammaproteobacteria bacterium]
MNGPALIVFARAPIAGRTKTRLIGRLGATGAAVLYARLLLNTLRQVETLDIERLLYVDDLAARAYFESRLMGERWQIHVQCGDDLGTRMANAFAETLQNHTVAILIGSDIVDFSAEDIADARRRLASGDDAVLGPSADGGYWLIGLRQPARELFEAMDWGTATVYAATSKRLSAGGKSWTAVALRHDIDTTDDLTRQAAAIEHLPQATAVDLAQAPLLAS